MNPDNRGSTVLIPMPWGLHTVCYSKVPLPCLKWPSTIFILLFYNKNLRNTATTKTTLMQCT